MTVGTCKSHSVPLLEDGQYVVMHYLEWQRSDVSVMTRHLIHRPVQDNRLVLCRVDIFDQIVLIQLLAIEEELEAVSSISRESVLL